MPSTVIAALHYNEQTHMLTIVFRGQRGSYRYFDVPAEEYAAFRAAPSKGAYLNEVFKLRGYRYERAKPSR
jgi:hypothetical protein